jgi:hypothetical protein
VLASSDKRLSQVVVPEVLELSACDQLTVIEQMLTKGSKRL